MKRLRRAWFGAWLGILALAALGLTAVAQTPRPAAGPFDDAARKAAIGEAAKMLRDRYIFPEVGVKAADKIEAELAAGRYNALTERGAFATKVTADLYEATRDKHLRVSALGPAPAGASPPPRSEAGIVRTDMLADNIGYIEVIGYPQPEQFKPVLDKAMATLAGARAVIVDHRRNRGGSPESGSYFMSHFVDPAKPVHINTFINRTPGTTTFTEREVWSVPTKTNFAGKPVYVLTSGTTFSGGEGFAYFLQAMKIAKVVGETTGGGANPGGTLTIAPQLSIFLPVGRPRSAVTGTNWEGVGVKPDVAVAAEDALKAALEQLGQKPAAKDIDALSKTALFRARSTSNPATEATMRKMITGLAKGAPDYDLLAPDFAAVTRDQLPALQEKLSALGEITSVEFQGIGPAGADIYRVDFAKGALIWRIMVDAEGKATMSTFQTAAPKQ